jgi:hypothetical protein
MCRKCGQPDNKLTCWNADSWHASLWLIAAGAQFMLAAPTPPMLRMRTLRVDGGIVEWQLKKFTLAYRISRRSNQGGVSTASYQRNKQEYNSLLYCSLQSACSPK